MQFVITGLIELFELYIIYRFMHIFFEVCIVERKFEICVYFLKLGIGEIIIHTVNYAFVNMISVVIMDLLITICYEGKLKKKIFVAITVFGSKVIAESVVAVIVGVRGFDVIDKSLNLDFFMTFMCELIYWFIYLVIKQFRFVKNNVELPVKFTVLIIGIEIVLVFMQFAILKQEQLDNMLAAMSMLIVFLVNILLIYLYDSLTNIVQETAKRQILEREKLYFHNQSELLQKNFMELRLFRHDLKNKLYVLDKMLEQEKYDETRQYVSKMTEKIAHTMSYSQTGNIAIDSIINYKLTEVANHNVEIITDIMIPENIRLDEDDIIIILGNLLDNALEALKKCENKKTLYLSFCYKQGYLIIEVKNTYQNIIIKRKGKIITSKKDKRNHGIGLQSITSVVNRYEGVMESHNDEKWFSVKIILPVLKERE